MFQVNVQCSYGKIQYEGGAKGEKVGFTKKTVYTAIKGIYASFFFLYCIIPRLIPAQSLLEHLFSFINYSPFPEKNGVFSLS